MNIAKKLAIGVALAAALMAGTASAKDIKIGLVVKSLGNGFFEAANKGAEEAAKDLGGVKVIYTGPTTTTAEGQIEVINSLIAQGVDAIAISANDPDAVVPALKKATQRGIKVISFDSGVAPAGRILQLNPSSNELIGKMCLTLVKDHLDGGKGDFAILSATTTSTNQNVWIGEMKKQMKDFPGLNLVTTVYGDDLSDKSYREAQGILTSHPEVKVIVAPTTVGVLAASQAVKDAGKIGKVYVTGLGLPSEMAGAIKSGATKEFAIWNPIDLGYSTIQIAYRIVKGETDGKPGSEIKAGRMGTIKVGANGEAAMADPFIYNASNIDQFSKVF
ncbi:rhamnose ABC transporter substrate-binding protein [Rhizobium tubonense]|uniref:Rhamnose ABC transporter substrate-binding protein n=1 Tax=Rhizobium tubonense TaxID=484088 RepID=A0A2W4C321_9HYPH|nr:rhamnose ABC transporter substrate-binding protein [Rhizobium tubonense]PZM08199.1 rhamnose ABC transporter substrate-binding protein [Rhizobium tubonense]